MKPVLLVLVLVISSVYGQDDGTCTTIYDENIDGTCIPISECPELIKSIKLDREYVQQFHCGFVKDTPKVCCPPKNPINTISPPETTTSTTTKTSPTSSVMTNFMTTAPSKDSCVTRAGTFGTCVGIRSCPKLRMMLNRRTAEDLDYVQRSRCIGPMPISVCCEVVVPAPAETVSNRFTQCQQMIAPPDSNSGCCGIESNAGNRIIGGLPAGIDQYPWLALIEYDEKRPALCGGSLISSLYVLTAAHCLLNEKKSRGAKSVRLGEYNTANEGPDCVEIEGNGTDCTSGSISIKIASEIIHPKYNDDKMIHQINDIALIKLQEMAPFTEFIRPICLPTIDITKTKQIENLRLFVAGWGAVSPTESTSSIKLHVDLPLVKDQHCRKLYSRNKVPIIWDKQLCAGGEAGKDSCKGDSGGPLMNFNNDTFFEIDGIISFGVKQCGNMGQPSIYTKVFEYIDWINLNTI